MSPAIILFNFNMSKAYTIIIFLRMATKLGEDVIEMYRPYKNDKADWKNTVISKQKF